MKVAVTGATGFIGRALVAALRARGDSVVALARDPARAKEALGTEAVKWDANEPAPAAALSGCDAVVHLAGEGVADKRWSEARKKLLLESRVKGTANLVAGLASASPRPKVLISGSATGYYGNVPEGDLDESATAGSDFLARICREWEEAGRGAEALGLRVVYLRTGIVVGKGGGALAKMLLPFRMGAGGPTGSGTQWMSWIHLDDEVGLILHALGDARVIGALNATAPAPVRNRDFAKALGRVVKRPAVIPTPAFALRLMFGELADAALLAGQRVLPKKALATGYAFKHTDIDGALRASV